MDLSDMYFYLGAAGSACQSPCDTLTLQVFLFCVKQQLYVFYL